MAFKDNSLTTSFASTAAQGLELLQAEPHDLIVADVDLPDAKGLEFVERARAVPGAENAPVIAVAAEAEKSLVVAAAQLKVASIVLKPLNIRDLAARIEELLTAPKLSSFAQEASATPPPA